MKIPFLLPPILCLSAFASHAFAQLRWDNALVLAHATAEDGKAFAHFTFVNAGDHPVKITRTETTCGCTAAVTEKRIYAPGEKGDLAVSFTTSNRHGLYEEPITVKTDDDKAGTVLKLRVLVTDVLDLKPTLVFWREGEARTPKSIHVQAPDVFGVKDLEVTSSDPGVITHVQTIKAGSEYNIVVTPPAQRTRAKLSIKPIYPTSKEPKIFTAYVRAN